MNSVHKVLMSKDLIPAKMDGYYFHHKKMYGYLTETIR